jgi:hypothetical protein
MTTPSATPPAPGTPPPGTGTPPPAAPAPGTPEYDAAMAAKMGGTGTPAPERPTWLPEKFKSPEDLAKAYAELERAKGAAPAGTPPAPGTPPAAGSDPVNFDALAEEYVATGALKPETRAALNAQGFSDRAIDTYIAGAKAQAEAYDNAAYAAAGGTKEAFEAVAAWAGTALAPSERAAFTAAVQSGNVDTMKLAVEGVTAKYRAANPSLLMGGTGGTAPTGVFASRAELTAAMKDPRYKTDPAYRDEVAQKLARSNVF